MSRSPTSTSSTTQTELYGDTSKFRKLSLRRRTTPAKNVRYVKAVESPKPVQVRQNGGFTVQNLKLVQKQNNSNQSYVILKQPINSGNVQIMTANGNPPVSVGQVINPTQQGITLKIASQKSPQIDPIQQVGKTFLWSFLGIWLA